jgi:hypothetical protein
MLSRPLQLFQPCPGQTQPSSRMFTSPCHDRVARHPAHCGGTARLFREQSLDGARIAVAWLWLFVPRARWQRQQHASVLQAAPSLAHGSALLAQLHQQRRLLSSHASCNDNATLSIH